MKTITVKGMTCQHCVKSVTEAIEKVDGTKNVKVDLDSGKASFDEAAPVDTASVKQAIEDIGFEVAN